MKELPALWAEACGYYHAAHAPSTNTQYNFHVRNFAVFCVAAGYEFRTPSEGQTMIYVALLARTVAAGKVRQYLKGLKDYYKQRGYTEFADPQAWPKLYATLKGVDRTKKLGVSQKCPVTPAMLVQFGKSLVRDARGCALWACVLITFFGYFRKSNTTSDGASPFGSGKCIRVCDIDEVPLKY